MALPPLELFSLEKKPPCCRVAFSRSDDRLMALLHPAYYPPLRGSSPSLCALLWTPYALQMGWRCPEGPPTYRRGREDGRNRVLDMSYGPMCSRISSSAQESVSVSSATHGCDPSHDSSSLPFPAATLQSIRNADVAQLVEQPIRNRQVTGSSPVVGSK
jgi:hypothetical protein